MICTFFGHREIYENIEGTLIKLLKELIETKDADLFYVGDTRGFDTTVIQCVKKLRCTYPHIQYYKVLAYMPAKNDILTQYQDDSTLFPEGLEAAPLRFAIEKRNEWMLNRADCVITYVTHDFGGAAKFKKIAERKKK